MWTPLSMLRTLVASIAYSCSFNIPEGQELFLTLDLHVKVKWSHSFVSNSLWPPWIVAYQAPPSLEFSRQEYWSGLPLPSPLGIPKTCKNSAKAYALVGVTCRLGPWCKSTNTVQKDKGKSLKLPSTLVKVVYKKLYCLLGQKCD